MGMKVQPCVRLIRLSNSFQLYCALFWNVVYDVPMCSSSSLPWWRVVLDSLWFSIQSSPRCSWRSIRCNTRLWCVCRDPMNCGFMNLIIYEYYLVLPWILICMIWYLCKSLRIIDLVWPIRLMFLAMGEVLSFGFNLAVSFPSDSRGNKTRIVLLPSRIKRWGLYHIAWVYPSTSCYLA